MTVTTDLGLSYELDIDINLAGAGVRPEIWQQIRFTSAIAPAHAAVMADAQTYDDEGAQNQAKIGETGSVAFTIQAQRNPDGTFLPEVQAILDAAKPGTRGNAALVEVRYYDSNGADYAFQGVFSVDVARQTTGNQEIAGWSITLTSKGPIQVIENPVLSGGGTPAAAPIITSATPSGAGEGDQVKITGSGFTGVTAVTVDGDPVEQYLTVGDNVLVIILPEGDPGDVPIIVTNATGPSQPFDYTRTL
ncbi:phage tail tube protein [Populibacterium corticicola]